MKRTTIDIPAFYQHVPRKGRRTFRSLLAMVDRNELFKGGGINIDGKPLDFDRPGIFLWTVVTHEVAHGVGLCMAPPWRFADINRRLMALSIRTRVDHEIRANLVSLRAIEIATGERLLSAHDIRNSGAGQGLLAIEMQTRYGGDVYKTPEYLATFASAMASGRGDVLDTGKRIFPRALRATDRIQRTRDITADARYLVSLAG